MSAGAGKSKSPERQGNSMDHIQCYLCKQYGHFKRECPKNTNGGQHRSSQRGGRGRTSPSPSGTNGSTSRQGTASPQRPTVSFEKRSGLSGSASAAISVNPYASLSDHDEEESISQSKLKSILKKSIAIGSASVSVNTPSSAPMVGSSSGNIGKPIHWGVDSMASLHISGNKSLFTGLKRCDPVKIQVANSEFVTANHRGIVLLRSHGWQHRVVTVSCSILEGMSQ